MKGVRLYFQSATFNTNLKEHWEKQLPNLLHVCIIIYFDFVMVFSTDCKTVALAFTSVSTERKCILQGHSWMLIRIVLGKKFVQDTKLVVKYEVYSFSLFQMTILQLHAQQFLLNINFLFLSFSNMCIHSHHTVSKPFITLISAS